jgi:WD40 repeat protein
VRLWNLRQPGDDPIVLRANQGKINSVAFSPDGARLAAGTDDQTILIWATRTEDLAQLVCGQVWRNLTLDEWRQFIGEGIPYERTCPNLPSGDVAAVKR